MISSQLGCFWPELTSKPPSNGCHRCRLLVVTGIGSQARAITDKQQQPNLAKMLLLLVTFGIEHFLVVAVNLTGQPLPADILTEYCPGMLLTSNNKHDTMESGAPPHAKPNAFGWRVPRRRSLFARGRARAYGQAAAASCTMRVMWSGQAAW